MMSYTIDSFTIEIIASSAALLHSIPKIINRYVTNPWSDALLAQAQVATIPPIYNRLKVQLENYLII